MTYIQMVDSDQAAGEVRAIYDAARTLKGQVPDATRIFSARPELMQGLEGLERNVVRGGSSLPRRLEDLIAVTVGRINRNAYVALSHAEALRSQGELGVREILAITGDFSHPALSGVERAALKFAEKVTQRSDGSTEADIIALREQGLDDAGVLDVVTAVAFWNFQTRLLSSLDVQPEPWKLVGADPELVAALAGGDSNAAPTAERVAVTADDSEANTEVGTKLLFSNELVNMWEVALRPGEIQPWHWHPYPYIVVSLEDGRSKITQRADGSERIVEERRGHLVFRSPSQTDIHNLTNIGDEPTITRLIEIKCAPEGTWAPAYINPEPPFADRSSDSEAS